MGNRLAAEQQYKATLALVESSGMSLESLWKSADSEEHRWVTNSGLWFDGSTAKIINPDTLLVSYDDEPDWQGNIEKRYFLRLWDGLVGKLLPMSVEPIGSLHHHSKIRQYPTDQAIQPGGESGD